MKHLRHIGIAGITIPGALLCIDTIVEESYKHFGKDLMMHPPITYTQPPLYEVQASIVDKNWNQVAKDLLVSIDRLQKVGAEFVIIPSNAPHYAIKQVQEQSPIPVLSMVDVVANECKRRGFKKVGILGITVTMSGGLYREPLQQVGIEPIELSPERQKAVNELIYDEIILGKPTSQTAEKMRVFIQELKDRGADAFIAGCTEIPVVITKESDSPLPFIDTTRLLARKAFAYAIEM